MAIPFGDDVIEWLYRFLGRIGLALTAASLPTYAWTGRLGISVWMFAIGVGAILTFGRWARRMAKAEADLYSSAPEVDPASLRSRWTLRFPAYKRHRG